MEMVVATISRATAACTLCQKGAMYRGWCQRCGGRDGGGKRQSTETGHALPCLGSASPLHCVARCDPHDPPDANCVVPTVVSCTGPSHMRSPFACQCTELHKKHPVLARNKRTCRKPRRGGRPSWNTRWITIGGPGVEPVKNNHNTRSRCAAALCEKMMSCKFTYDPESRRSWSGGRISWTL